MTTAIASEIESSQVHVRSLTAEELAFLAATFDGYLAPVWIHDRAGRCVYHNPAALDARPHAAHDCIEDILDYQDQPLGQLRIRRPAM